MTNRTDNTESWLDVIPAIPLDAWRLDRACHKCGAKAETRLHTVDRPPYRVYLCGECCDIRTDAARLTEMWRAVPYYRGRYEVSSFGRVRSLRNGDRRGGFERKKPLLLKGNRVKGYRRVDLTDEDGERRTIKVCRLVLWAFDGPCPDGKQATHLNGDSRDDRLSNLAWRTQAQNNADKVRHGTSLKGEDNPSAVVTEDDVLDMRCRAWSGESYASIARDYPITERAVSAAVNGRTWSHTLEHVRLDLARALREVTR